jgi:UDP-N-acetylmuramoyl-L-alanyl-D-glutamate--2,6-diaminopimelate ligase
LDSRSIRSGDLYLALPGRITHGARYSADAVAAGAVAIVTDAAGAADCGGLGVPVLVVEDPRALSGPISAAVHGWPARSLQLLGITGTNGKSTVTAMVQAGLQSAGRRTGAIGTLGVGIGEEWLPGARTTPEATDLQAILAVMRAAEVQSVIMEVSSIALDEHRVDGFRFDVAGFTQMSQDHLDYHGDMESYFAAKARLFTPDHASMGVVGIDDEYGRRLVREASIPLFTWSIDDRSADWYPADIRPIATGSAVSVIGPHDEQLPLHVPLPGPYNVANALCAFGMLRSIGVDAEDAARGIGGVSVPGRMQVVGRRTDSGSAAGIVGVVDYAHTPDAITRVLEALQGDGRVVAVLGAGGDRDASKRPLMGAAAARLADVLVVTDDNPRSEDPSAIRAAIIEGATSVARDRGGAVLERGDRAEAIALAVGLARPGDTVIVLGKGHETGQEVAGVVNAFDDSEVLRAALRSGVSE